MYSDGECKCVCIINISLFLSSLVRVPRNRRLRLGRVRDESTDGGAGAGPGAASRADLRHGTSGAAGPRPHALVRGAGGPQLGCTQLVYLISYYNFYQ